MKATLSADGIRKLKPGSYDVYDTKQSGLVLRVRWTGRHSYLARLGRGQWYTLGQASKLGPDEARKLAREAFVNKAHGQDPIAERKLKRGITFAAFLREQYEPWAVAHLKSAPSFVGRIRAQFEPLFGAHPLAEITPFAVEKWRSGRLRGKDAVTPATTNRDLQAFKACLGRAVAWGVVRVHPLAGFKKSKEDTRGTVRYLSADEEVRLRLSLVARDNRRRTERAHANTWRAERQYPQLPAFTGRFTDYLHPLVRLALNSGLRRGELLNLDWRDVDLVGARLTVRGEGAKSGKTRHLPLNVEALDVLRAWRPDDARGFVFAGDAGARLKDIKAPWLRVAKVAGLQAFRFHDCRHSFASQLVQHGVDLASVRALLGHSDFKLTLRYAHLADENLSAAVAKIGAR